MSEEYRRKYLNELAVRYPTRNAVYDKIVRLNAILNLPKGTEHFISDIHGEYEALSHIMKNASGVIKRKAEGLFSDELTSEQISELCTTIYYPEEKLTELKRREDDGFFADLLPRLVLLCRTVSSKYTRARVRERLLRSAGEFADIICELINSDADPNKCEYYKSIYKTIIRVGARDGFISAVCSAIKELVVDRLHVVGDIFDRGARADIVMDELMRLLSIDIQWGNHDALWMGAAAGSQACVAAVLNNSITYRNLDVIEVGYGISLRPLAQFAAEIYSEDELSAYMPKGNSDGDMLKSDDDRLIAMMHKAISVIQFKLEGQIIARNPEFNMDDRRLLHRIDFERGVVEIKGRIYKMRDTHFPTINEKDPYSLSEGEDEVINYLACAFMRSERLARHIGFIYERGGAYKVHNGNLLFHGCIPMTDDGELMPLAAAGGRRGRELMDFCDRVARQGYFAKEASREREQGRDFLWFLWCGKDSPLCGRKRITTFERLLIEQKEAWVEPRNGYYLGWNDNEIASRILSEFSLDGAHSHIINGHIPINKGEDPIKAGGRIIVIDGGFCSAYYSRTGIGGYTLIYNADGMRISAHEPFSGKENAINTNADIVSDTIVFEKAGRKIRIRETDDGKIIRDKIADLLDLLHEYESGEIKERELEIH